MSKEESAIRWYLKQKEYRKQYNQREDVQERQKEYRKQYNKDRWEMVKRLKAEGKI